MNNLKNIEHDFYLKLENILVKWNSSRFFRSQNVTEEEAIDFWREAATNHVLCVIDRREQINIIQSLLRTFWSKAIASYFCDLVENIYLWCFSAKCEIFRESEEEKIVYWFDRKICSDFVTQRSIFLA